MTLFFLAAYPLAITPIEEPRIFKAVRSPEVSADRRVTFRFFAPNAKRVTVKIEESAPLTLAKDEKGVWSGATLPLASDRYIYSFIVDGVQLADPANPLRKNIATGGAESIVHVPGNPSLSWEERDVPRGVIHRHRYKSKILGEHRSFLVYTPPGYNPARKEPYPTLYLMHGVMEDETAWTEAGRAHVILDNLIAQKQAVPMMIVMPLGYGFPNVPDRAGDLLTGRADHRKDMDRLTETIRKEIMPRVGAEYRTSARREDRAIAGLSMGGAQALFLGMNTSDQFGTAASFSGAFVLYGARFDPWFQKQPDQELHITITCGTGDFLLASYTAMKRWLTGKEMKFTAIESPGGHTWPVWRRNLTAFAKTLFR